MKMRKQRGYSGQDSRSFIQSLVSSDQFRSSSPNIVNKPPYRSSELFIDRVMLRNNYIIKNKLDDLELRDIVVCMLSLYILKLGKKI